MLRDNHDPRRYPEIVREERQFAAWLYHWMLSDWPNNLRRFVVRQFPERGIAPDENSAVYFEFTGLRDDWHARFDGTFKGAELDRVVGFVKRALADLTDTPGLGDRLKAKLGEISEPSEYSEALVGGRKSTRYIQMPGRWSKTKIAEWLADWQDLSERELCIKAMCHVAWAHNCKPDIVIEIDAKSCIALELKVDSGVGKYDYPDTGAIPSPIRQTVIQDLALRLFGYQDVEIYLLDRKNLVKVNNLDGATQASTGKAGLERHLELAFCGYAPPFIRRAIANFPKNKKKD